MKNLAVLGSSLASEHKLKIHRLMELLAVVKTVRAKKHVKKKAAKASCLQCERLAAIGRRGLCDFHYNQFDNVKRKQPTEKKRIAFDCEQVAAGMILESRRGRQPKSPNPFAEAS